jgi:hypothetical protein
MKGEENRFTQILNLLYIYFHVEINVTITKIIKKKNTRKGIVQFIHWSVRYRRKLRAVLEMHTDDAFKSYGADMKEWVRWRVQCQISCFVWF